MREGKSNDPFSEVGVIVDPPHLLLYSFVSSSLKHKFIEISFVCDFVSKAFQLRGNGTATELVSYLPETSSSIFFYLKMYSVYARVYICAPEP